MFSNSLGVYSSKPSRKIGTVKRQLLELCWPMQGLWPKSYFLGINLFGKEFRETSQNCNSISSCRHFLLPYFIFDV